MKKIFTFRLALIILISGLLLPSCSKWSKPVSADKVKAVSNDLFSYDASALLDLRVDSTIQSKGILIKDISYLAYNSKHGRIRAYLITPEGSGPFAGIVYFHWLGKPNGNRKEFYDEALLMAEKGTASLLIQGYFPWTEAPVDAHTDKQQVIDQTIEIRRAIDILLEQKNMDAKRIAFVGHDYGAMFGAIAAGIEQRIKAYVLVTAMGTFSDWSLKYWKATGSEGENVYKQALDPVDPVHYIAYASPAPLFFQFSNKDIYISHDEAEAFYNAASQPKEIKWYDAPHDMNIPEAKNDRMEWVERQLGIK